MKGQNRRAARVSYRVARLRASLVIEPMESRLLLAVFSVTSAASSGANTLADAINLSNAATGQTNTIDFNIPGSGAQTINLTTALPTITNPVVIDGTSQASGFAANNASLTDNATLTIVINGSGITPTGSLYVGLDFASTAIGSTVKGLDLEGFTGDGIDISANQVTVTGNFIGVGPDGLGSALTANGGAGVSINAATGALIGDSTVADRNLITNNGGAGILINGGGSSQVSGNFLGVDNSGGTVTTPGSLLGNLQGVSIVDSTDNTIGGSVAGAGNVISANKREGVSIDQSSSSTSASGNLVAGNVIGTDTAGSLLIGNATDGVLVTGASGVTIGGATAASGNTIAGNAVFGVHLVGAGQGVTPTPSPVVVEQNAIGFVQTGVSPATFLDVPNGTVGTSATGGVLIDGSRATIESNAISGNQTAGVQLDADVSNTQFLNNLIGLASDGTTILPNQGGGIAPLSLSGIDASTLSLDGDIVSHNTGVGIDLTGANNLSITGETIQGNGGGGLMLNNVNMATITGSTIGGATALLGNGLFGVSIQQTVGALLQGDLVSHNQGAGVSILSTSNATIKGLTSLGNAGNGLEFIRVSPNGMVSGSTISGNAGDGVYVDEFSNNLAITGSTIQSNGYAGVMIDDSSNGATITASTIGGTVNGQGNNQVGVDVEGSNQVTVGAAGAGNGVLIAGNGGFGVLFRGSTGSTLINDTVENTFALGADLGAGVRVVDSPSTTLNGDLIVGNAEIGLSVTGLSANLAVTGSTFQTNAGGGISLIGTDVASGDTISGNTVGGATSLLGNSSFGIRIFDAPGVLLVADVVTHTLGQGIAISSGSNGATITGATINANNTDGIDVSNSTNVSISGATVLSNQATGISVASFSNGATITGSTIGGVGPGAGNRGAGIDIGDSNGAMLINDLVAGTVPLGITPGSGIDLTNAGNTSLSGVQILNNSGVGLHAFSDSGMTGLIVTNTTIKGNALLGVQLVQASFTSITATTISGNSGSGLDVINSVALILDGSVIQDNLGSGVVLAGGSDGAVLTGDTIGGTVSGQGNGGIGVDVENSNQVAIGKVGAGNGVIVAGNQGFGILINGSTGSTLVNVTVENTAVQGANLGDGVRLVDSPSTSMTGDTITGNAGIGLNVSGGAALLNANGLTVQANLGGGIALTGNGVATATASTISASTISGNGIVGILLNDAPGVTLSTDVVSNNLKIGILLLDASNTATITNAIITGNAGDGLDVNDSSGLLLGSSAIQGNGGAGVTLANGSGSTSILDTTIGGTVSGQGNGGIGVSVFDSPSTRLSGVTVAGNAGFGVEIVRSDSANLSSDVVTGTLVSGANLGDGIKLVDSNAVTLAGDLTSSNAGLGINAAGSSSLIVQSTTTRSNLGGGLGLLDSPGALITASLIGGLTATLGNHGVGMQVLNSNDLSLQQDVVENNQGVGILIASGSLRSQIGETTILNNAGLGLAVTDSSFLNVTGSTIQANQGGGVSLSNDGGSLISNSTIGGTVSGQGNVGFGLLSEGSDNVTIGGAMASTTHNLIAGNLGDGIDAINEYGLHLQDNDLLANTGSGIAASGSESLYVANSTIENQGGNGVTLVDGTSYVQIQDNTITGNLDGVYANGSTNVSLGGLAAPGDVLSANRGNGVELVSTVNSLIAGEFLGTDATGTIAQGNAFNGVLLNDCTGVTLTQTMAGLQNVIASNGANGVALTNGSTANVIESSLIGVGSSGQPLANLGNGVVVDSSNFNIIGGTTASAGDTISGNDGSGVLISGTDVHGNLVGFDQIGTDTTGKLALPNQLHGVFLDNVGLDNESLPGSGNTVANSVISGNLLSGVEIAGANAAGNRVLNNMIGTDIAGALPLPNQGDGVTIASASAGNVISGNTVCANLGNGVRIENTPLVTLSGDEIGTNANGMAALGNALNGVSIVNGWVGTSITFSTISANLLDGIAIRNTVAVTIGGDMIGTSADSSIALGNRGEGVNVADSNETRIGLAAENLGNVISANLAGGVELDSSNNASLENNRIGTVSDGTTLPILPGTSTFGEQPFGIFLNQSAGNTIGGAFASLARNVISGQNFVHGVATASAFGIQIFGSGSSENVVMGNAIGTTYPGNGIGVLINQAPLNLIGGPTGFGNVISGGLQANVRITGAGSSFNTVAANTIGGTSGPVTNPNAPNQNGVLIDGAANSTISGNTILGNNIGVQVLGYAISDASVNTGTLITGNAIQSNQYGVLINNSGSVTTFGNPLQFSLSNTVTTNTISSNTRAGIEILGAPSSGNLIESNVETLNQFGIYVESSPGNTIGGTTVAQGNLIADSGKNRPGAGIVLDGQASSNNVVSHNTVTRSKSYGIVFNNTPGSSTTQGVVPNVLSGNTVSGSTVRDIVITTPPKTIPVKAASISLFSGRASMFHKRRGSR